MFCGTNPNEMNNMPLSIAILHNLKKTQTYQEEQVVRSGTNSSLCPLPTPLLENLQSASDISKYFMNKPSAINRDQKSVFFVTRPTLFFHPDLKFFYWIFFLNPESLSPSRAKFATRSAWDNVINSS
jgi:hypothetical protein